MNDRCGEETVLAQGTAHEKDLRNFANLIWSIAELLRATTSSPSTAT